MVKPYCVYILRSLKDGKNYIGFTNNLSRRINEHNEGLVKSTRFRKPMTLIYQEEFSRKRDAMNREKFFKTGKGREFINSLGLK